MFVASALRRSPLGYPRVKLVLVRQAAYKDTQVMKRTIPKDAPGCTAHDLFVGAIQLALSFVMRPLSAEVIPFGCY